MCFYAKCFACHIFLTAEVFSFSEGIHGFVWFSMKSYLWEILNAKTRKTFRIICACICVCERIYRNVNLIWGWRIGFVFSFIIVYYYYVSISLSQKQLLASGASWEKKSKLSFMKYITVIMRFTRVTRRRLYHFG